MPQSVSEAFQLRLARLLTARARLHSKLPRPQLELLLQLLRAFEAAALQDGALRPSAALKNAVQVTCRAYLEQLHADADVALRCTVERETWEVPGPSPETAALQLNVQGKLKRLVRAAVKAHSANSTARPTGAIQSSRGPRPNGPSPVAATPPASDLGIPAPPAPDDGLFPFSAAEAEVAVAPEELDPGGRVAVTSQLFRPLASTPLLLDCLLEYLRALRLLPEELCGDVASRCLLFLQLWTRAAQQQVLGGGARATAAVRVLSTGAFMACSQAVGLLLALVPLVQAIVALQVRWAAMCLWRMPKTDAEASNETPSALHCTALH